jgi:NADPH-dependent 2,4-dienoyl-CoA reductase/sulfur reductase-like enzyme
MNELIELLIVGAGPAGMAAALAAANSGQQITIIDENPAVGGQIWRGGSDPAARAMWSTLQRCANVRFMGGARVVASAGAHTGTGESPHVGNGATPRTLLLDGGTMLAWQRLILCTGARELLLPFPGWTLPGVTGAGGLQALIKGGMPISGKHVVVAGTGPLLLAVADTVRRQGGQVAAIIEQRSTRQLAGFARQLALSHRGKLLQAARLMAGLAGIPYRHDATVTQAHGDTRLHSVTVVSQGQASHIDCDFLACGYGLLPNLELATMLGCHTDHGRALVDESQASSDPAIWAAGESTGIGGVDKALAEGRIAGLCASGQQPSSADVLTRTRAAAFGTLLACSFPLAPALRELCCPGTIVCRCEDVRSGQLAVHADWRSAKLQTRVGMGPCQGRVCGAACQFLYGWQGGSMRQPIFPTSAATLAECAKDKAS